MTAPVPPDANGLREAVESALALLDEDVELDLDDYEHRIQRVYNILRTALLAASEAAPTAGERDPRCIHHRPCRCGLSATPPADEQAAPTAGECTHKPEHVTSGGLRWPLVCDVCSPATPPTDDASEGLSESEREALGSHDLSCRFPDVECKCVVSLFEHRSIVSAATTRARAEGAAIGFRAALDPGSIVKRGAAELAGEPFTERMDQWQRRAMDEGLARLARSDAAPHTGAQA